MVYPTLKRRRWPLALLAGGVALTASMMTAPALAAELPSGGDDDQPLALVNANASESGASAADELAAVAVAGEPQGPAVDMNSGPSTGVGASADPAAEQKTDEKSIDAAVDVQVPAQQQGQAASAKAAAADGVAPVAKAPAPAETGYTGWAVEDRNNGYGLQRYWMVNGKTATSELLDAAETGWWAYARPEGFVVRGRWTDPSTGYVYLANNDGRLEDPGWVVSSSYGQGLQRYWVDAKAHAAVPGYSSDGWDHYTTSSGYVLRGRLTAPNGYVYLANNDGRLEGPGWVVSSSYGQGLQRYWVDAKAHAAVPGYSKDGWAHYTTSSGYVLRGVSILGDGTFYRANNDGKVLDSTEGSKDYIGWWVTSSLGHGLQRYWLNSGKLALSTLIDPALGHGAYWAYARPEGFVVRGKWDKGNGHVYVADNDGVLPSVSGWMVTGKYDGGTLQRYYMDGDAHAAVTSFFRVDGNLYYGIGWQGYVLRNSTIAYDGSFYVADNDGVLTKRKYSPLIQSMVDRAQGFSSSTGWLVLVSRSDCHVAVFSGGRGNWNLYDDFACAVGASSSPTITGTYATQSRRPSLDTDSRARYCTQINGGYFFHTILSSNSELGHWTSHGCIRLPVEKARWIYSNLPLRTTVNIY